GVEIIGDILYLTTYTINPDTNKIIKMDSLSVMKTDTNVGDVNFDGKVTAADARLVLRCSAGLELFTVAQFSAADVNGDTKITAADARLVLRTAAGLR
ncbi:MAG: dockerin type I repeat-containing protein, partial [Clostridia bacterium]|nr:dockerin type I repeat-containing protein [Clostridia bacterium]